MKAGVYLEMFKNIVPPKKTGTDLHISPSTEENITKLFKEPGAISVQEE